jgi:hypothetical protein
VEVTVLWVLGVPRVPRRDAYSPISKTGLAFVLEAVVSRLNKALAMSETERAWVSGSQKGCRIITPQPFRRCS